MEYRRFYWIQCLMGSFCLLRMVEGQGQNATNTTSTLESNQTLDLGTLDSGTLDLGTLDPGTLELGTLDAGPLVPDILDPVLVDDVAVGGTVCPQGMGYPASCPRPGVDPPDRTRCCRYYREPSCCQERATHVCGVQIGHRSRQAKFDYDPGPEWKTVFCPQPDDYDGQTVCCYDITEEGHQISCCGELFVVGIAAGVFGIILFVFACAGSICFLQVKRGRWRWIQTGSGNYTLVHAPSKSDIRQEYLTEDWE